MEVTFRYDNKKEGTNEAVLMPIENMFGNVEIRQGEYVRIFRDNEIPKMFKISKIFYDVVCKDKIIIDITKIVILEE